jgi:hypothetical protein
MAVGGISGGASMPGGSAMDAAQATAAASMRLLDAMLEMATSMNAQLLEGMRAASPAGVGGSVDTWA